MKSGGGGGCGKEIGRHKERGKEKVFKRFVKLTCKGSFALTDEKKVLSPRKTYFKQTFKEYQHSKEV